MFTALLFTTVKTWKQLKCASTGEWISEETVTQSCPTVCDPIDCSPPDSSVHGILQARILEWIAISFFGMDKGVVYIYNGILAIEKK